jgi:hypothetical protein
VSLWRAEANKEEQERTHVQTQKYKQHSKGTSYTYMEIELDHLKSSFGSVGFF